MKALRSIAFVIATLVAAGSAAAQPLVGRTPDEVAVLAADMRQRDAVASGDPARLAAIAHPHLLVNSPFNRVLTRDGVTRMMASGEIRNDNWERIPESVSVTRGVGIVMGRESVTAAAGSEQAQMYGVGTRLERRYTNVYLRTGREWLFLARHANVVPPSPAGAPK